jgi:hypothetical protein
MKTQEEILSLLTSDLALASTQPKPTLERLLKLHRGHWVEHGIE